MVKGAAADSQIRKDTARTKARRSIARVSEPKESLYSFNVVQHYNIDDTTHPKQHACRANPNVHIVTFFGPKIQFTSRRPIQAFLIPQLAHSPNTVFLK